jgi:hypothetical protein
MRKRCYPRWDFSYEDRTQSLQSFASSTSPTTSAEDEKSSQKNKIPTYHIEVSQHVGRGVRNKASRTTRKTNPKQNIDHNQRPDRSVGLSRLGSQGNIFVAYRVRSIPSVLSGSALAERNASSQAGQTAELPKFGPRHTVHWVVVSRFI